MFVTTDDARRARARAFVTLFLMLRALSSVMHGFTIFDVADILKFPTQVLLPKLVIYSLDSHTSTEQIIINPNVNLSQNLFPICIFCIFPEELQYSTCPESLFET